MDPLSLTQAKRLAASADTLLLRATRPADLETPIGAFLRLDDGTTGAHVERELPGLVRLARIDAVIEARLQSVTAILDRLVDPHNVAAILRTGEGMGLCAVHVVPGADRDAFAHRKVTQDAHKWIDVVHHDSGASAARFLAARGFAVFAGHLERGARPPADLPVDRPVALLFGHEHEGPSRETLDSCDGTFRIPMAGFTQSFNVSVAAGIALSQICAARRAFLKKPGDLDVPRKQAFRSRYLRLGAKRRLPAHSKVP